VQARDAAAAGALSPGAVPLRPGPAERCPVRAARRRPDCPGRQQPGTPEPGPGLSAPLAEHSGRPRGGDGRHGGAARPAPAPGARPARGRPPAVGAGREHLAAPGGRDQPRAHLRAPRHRRGPPAGGGGRVGVPVAAGGAGAGGELGAAPGRQPSGAPRGHADRTGPPPTKHRAGGAPDGCSPIWRPLSPSRRPTRRASPRWCSSAARAACSSSPRRIPARCSARRSP
jgi:hypothetical protein